MAWEKSRGRAGLVFRQRSPSGQGLALASLRPCLSTLAVGAVFWLLPGRLRFPPCSFAALSAAQPGGALVGQGERADS